MINTNAAELYRDTGTCAIVDAPPITIAMLADSTSSYLKEAVMLIEEILRNIKGEVESGTGEMPTSCIDGLRYVVETNAQNSKALLDRLVELRICMFG